MTTYRLALGRNERLQPGASAWVEMAQAFLLTNLWLAGRKGLADRRNEKRISEVRED